MESEVVVWGVVCGRDRREAGRLQWGKDYLRRMNGYWQMGKLGLESGFDEGGSGEPQLA